MTTYGGGELNAPDYDGTEMLLMPTLRCEEWANLDQPTAEALIAALHVAGSINAKRRVQYLGQASVKILAHIQAARNEIADSFASGLGTAGPPVRAQQVSRTLDLFPRSLRGLPPLQPPAHSKSIWELYGYSPEIFEEIKKSAAQTISGSYEGLPQLELNVLIAQRLFQRFEDLKFTDFSDRPTPDFKDGKRIVDFGCDLKLLMTWLSVVGPVNCEIGVGKDFPGLKGDKARQPSPADKVTAVVPTPPEKDLKEEYVTVVAWRPGPALKEKLFGRLTLRDEIARVDRESGPLDIQYLLRRTNEDGHTDQTWGDGGYAWMPHMEFRRVIRWFRAKVPDSFLGASASKA